MRQAQIVKSAKINSPSLVNGDIIADNAVELSVIHALKSEITFQATLLRK